MTYDEYITDDRVKAQREALYGSWCKSTELT